ncbi:MAG: AAA family ATPase, partial [Desulfovibrionaceae bacterium]|nr:AAA family ATPase [Desulfovibrionaceae bacterium]
MRENNCFYEDKTRFIRDWWNNFDEVTLITHPRRLGKTLLLNTVDTFFSPKFV